MDELELVYMFQNTNTTEGQSKDAAGNTPSAPSRGSCQIKDNRTRTSWVRIQNNRLGDLYVDAH